MPTSDNPFAAWSGAEFWRPWLQLAPTSLVQPITSGLTFNVNSHNSTAPQTEANVLARHSYGRQLGRITDALHALLMQLHEGKPPKDGPLGEFLAMREQIEKVKDDSAAHRLQQITSDLTRLKASDKRAYARLRDDLAQALKLSE
jgi:hypothetical protein